VKLRVLLVVLVLAAGVLGTHVLNSTRPPLVTHGTGACATTVSPATGGDGIASVIVSTPPGETICLAGGHYPMIDVSGAAHDAYVTIRPAPGAMATVAGMQLQDSSHLRFEGLRMTEGFNVVGSGHDYQWLGNTFESPAYALTLYGESSPIRHVLFERNYVDNATFGSIRSESGEECASGYSRGEDVVIKHAEGVTIAHNTFNEADEHYIQGGGAGREGVTVEHNLFEGYYKYGCAHLNVWQIFAGGTNDTFADNIVFGKGVGYGVGPFETGDEEASGDGLEFENGAGSADCGEGPMKGTVIENNLWVDGASAQPMQIYTTDGLTIKDNTSVRSGYGSWVLEGNEEKTDGRPGCGPSTHVTFERNIDVESQQPHSGEDFIVDGQGAGLTCDKNVSSDSTAAEIARCGEHHVVNWAPVWDTVAWNPIAETDAGEHFPVAPPGFYVPRDLAFAAGYEGGGGP
jgi:hypothetical protein